MSSAPQTSSPHRLSWIIPLVAALVAASLVYAFSSVADGSLLVGVGVVLAVPVAIAGRKVLRPRGGRAG